MGLMRSRRVLKRAVFALAILAFALVPPSAGLAATTYPVSTGADGPCTYAINTAVDTAVHPVLNCTTITVNPGVTVIFSGPHVADLRATGLVLI